MLEYTSTDHPDSDLALLVYKEKSKQPKASRKEYEKAKKVSKMADTKLKLGTERYKEVWPTRDATVPATNLLDEMEAAQNSP
ncbi:hypothetical protein Tco_1268616 [Tanacetum coccineum]